MPIDAQVEALVSAMAAANLPDFSTLSPAEARAVSGALAKAAQPGVELWRVEDISIERPQGAPLPARLYRPGDRPAGLLVYCHGGGWVLGDLDSSDALLRLLCQRSGFAALSLDYGLAPENPFPAAIDDVALGLRWASETCGSRIGHSVPLAIGGDSAGANLATVAALAARNSGPALAFQLLFYPITDSDLETQSYQENAEAPILTKRLMHWFWDHYASDPADRPDWRRSPLRAHDLRGLPPTLIQTAEYDPLRDEGEAYAARLSEAGVPVVLQRRDGLVHGYGAMVTTVAAASEAVIAAADAMAAAVLGTEPN